MLTNYTPSVSVPNDSSQHYADGWTYGDWWLSKGGSVYADAGAGWHDEKAAGFWDRLALARKQTRKVGCEGDDGLLRIHLESDTCEVCKPRT